MKTSLGVVLSAGCLLAVACSLLSMTSSPVARGNANAEKQEAAPVEPDMHEFMEYVFQPTFLRLRAQMQAEPADNKAWKGIKSDALILAEGGNLLLIRDAGDEQSDWDRHSIHVRGLGGELYRAAQAKDYKTARGHYEKMVTNCNACHDQFADGEHQLTP
jgi:hypothetical protein